VIEQFDEVGRGPRIIVRPAWQWPAWLKAPWIAQDRQGSWLSFNDEPLASERRDSGWDRNEELCLNSPHIDFTPPPCTDWRESKRKNPNL
jgi:hypothetical protein